MDQILGEGEADGSDDDRFLSLWDQEDIYGGMAVYKALKPQLKVMAENCSW